MHGEADILSNAVHFDGQPDLRDKISGVRADNTCPNNLLCGGIKQQLRESLAASKCQSTATGSPGKDSYTLQSYL